MPDPGDSRRFPARQSDASDWLTLEIVEEGSDWASFAPGIEELGLAAGHAVARHARFEASVAAEACIALSDDATVRDLNARYRGMDKATNVLSFPVPADGADNFGEVRNLGDVILARETIAQEARDLDIPPGHHFQHLVVHGLLHLLGFDHDNDRDALEMEGLETEILASLGVTNPYAEAATSMEGAAPAPVRRHG
jgi:probable rRNA maturation factor